jgi:hypothetical protein
MKLIITARIIISYFLITSLIRILHSIPPSFLQKEKDIMNNTKAQQSYSDYGLPDYVAGNGYINRNRSDSPVMA